MEISSGTSENQEYNGIPYEHFLIGEIQLNYPGEGEPASQEVSELFEDLIQPHLGQMHTVANYRNQCRDDADDVVGDALEKFWKKLPDLEITSDTVAPYLNSTVRRASVDGHRERAKTYPVEPEKMEDLENARSYEIRTDDVDCARLIKVAKDGLKPHQFDMVRAMIEGVKPEDYADGKKKETTSATFSRVRSRLRNIYKEEGIDL